VTLDFDDIRDLREEWEATLPPAEYRARVQAQIEQMVVGQPGRAELLSCLAQDPDLPASEESLALARAAVDDGGPATVDPRVEVLRVLLALGRDEEATDLLRELVRARARDDVEAGLHATVGEVLEMAHRTREAHRFYTIGLKDFDPDRDDPDLDEDTCLSGRYRLRRQLGLGFDSFDRCLEELDPQRAAAIRERAAAEG
jgi:hypothetical protein